MPPPQLGCKFSPDLLDDLTRYNDAEAELDKRLSGYGSNVAGLLFVYQRLEKESREDPHSETLLMTAVLAGERLIKILPEDDMASVDVKLSLADLYYRRSKWENRIVDLESAIVYAGLVSRSDAEVPVRVLAYEKLSSFWEDYYTRSNKKDHLKNAWEALEKAAKLVGRKERQGLLATASGLRFKIDPEAIRPNLSVSMEDLSKKTLSWPAISQKKFRFIDARHLAAGKGLQVFELDALPRQQYIALSYVWRNTERGQAIHSNNGFLTIEGVTGADPISIDVLISACTCVETLGCELLWIDGICIIQNNEEDKAWQIQNMFDLYKNCKQSLVLPGGLSRLVSLTEPTPWIHRAWTLQEGVAPQESTCLFAWDKGNCRLQAFMPMLVEEVEEGRSAKASLYDLLRMNIIRRASITPISTSNPDPESAEEIRINILADENAESHLHALLGAIDYRDKEGLGTAVWRASLTRVASRPADAVFSIMGILGVDLDPLKFDPKDRQAATTALMQALLDKGERAEWLGAAPDLPRNLSLPYLPEFPTAQGGKAVIKVIDSEQEAPTYRPVSEVMGDTWWRHLDAPRGSMLDDGTLTFTARVIAVRKSPTGTDAADPEREIYASNSLVDKAWSVANGDKEPPFAVCLGKKERYTNAAAPMRHDPWLWLVMLVERWSSEGEFRCLGYASVTQEVADMTGWHEREIKLPPTTVQVIWKA